MTTRKNNTQAANTSTKKTVAKKTTTKKQAPKKAQDQASFSSYASDQIKQREALAQKIEKADKSSADFDAIQLAATQHNYYSFGSKVADVMKHANAPEKAVRNTFGKVATMCFILNGESLSEALKKAKHKANTTRQANGKTYNPQLSNFEKAIGFILSNIDKKQITREELKDVLKAKSTTQSSEFLKAFSFTTGAHWTGNTLETANADSAKVNTLKKAFGIK